MATIRLSGGPALPAEQIEMLNAGELCDLTIVVGEEEFRVHQLALASASPFVRRMLGNEMRESLSGVVTLGDMLPSTFSAVLTFIYNGNCDVGAGCDNLAAILNAAEMLQVDALTQATVRAIIDSLDHSECLRWWGLADRFDSAPLRDQARAVALAEFSRLPRETFRHLTEQQLQSLLEDDALCLEREEDAFEALIWWARDTNCEALPVALLETIRFAVMEPAFVRGTVHAEALMRTADGMEALARSFERVLWREARPGRPCFYINALNRVPGCHVSRVDPLSAAGNANDVTIKMAWPFGEAGQGEAGQWGLAFSAPLTGDRQWTVAPEVLADTSPWGIVAGVAQHSLMLEANEKAVNAERVSRAALGQQLSTFNPVVLSDFAYMAKTCELRGTNAEGAALMELEGFKSDSITFRYRRLGGTLDVAREGRPFQRVYSGFDPDTPMVAVVAVSNNSEARMRQW
jgi:hypothetical protein